MGHFERCVMGAESGSWDFHTATHLCPRGAPRGLVTGVQLQPCRASPLGPCYCPLAVGNADPKPGGSGPLSVDPDRLKKGTY